MSIPKKQTVSFIIAAYNEEKYIADCIDSCLNQTYPHIEVVITDDGSTDQTFEILKKKYSENNRVKFFKFHSNKKKIAAFNNSFTNSEGEYIALVGADDVNEPTRITEQIQLMTQYDLTYCDLKQVNQSNEKVINPNWLGRDTNAEISFDEMILNPWAVASILMKRTIAEKIFPLPENLPHEDWWIPLLASHDKNIFFLNRALYRYRIHENNSSGLHSDFSANKQKHLKQEVRDLTYYIQLRKYLEKKNETRFYDWIDLKIALLEVMNRKLIKNNNPQKESFQNLLNRINASKKDTVHIKHYERLLINYLDKYLYFGLWSEAHTLLNNLPPTEFINHKEYKLCIRMRYNSIKELRESFIYRLLKFTVSLKLFN